MRERDMPTEQPCSLETQEIIDEIDAYHRVIGTSPLKTYMPSVQEKAIEHWRAARPSPDMAGADEALAFIDAYISAFSSGEMLPGYDAACEAAEKLRAALKEPRP